LENSSRANPTPLLRPFDSVSTSRSSPIRPPPDWSKLDRFQNTISKETFLNRLETVYTKDPSWKKWIAIDESANQAIIGNYQLVFSPQDKPAPGSLFNWKTRADLSGDRALPLEDLVIAIDPGHIGGDFAKIEEREHNQDGLTIREGTMTLKTALILKPLLEKLGASAILVRSKLEPVTKNRAQDFADPSSFIEHPKFVPEPISLIRLSNPTLSSAFTLTVLLQKNSLQINIFISFSMEPTQKMNLRTKMNDSKCFKDSSPAQLPKKLPSPAR
jgi:hypothetical protein